MQTEDQPGLEGSHSADQDQDMAKAGIPNEWEEDPKRFPRLFALEGTTDIGSPPQQMGQAGDDHLSDSPQQSRSEEKRQQERRSLPWRLGLANLLSAGLHLLPIGLMGWQPGIPEEVEIISFQWVEVEAEPPPEPDFMAPISARASGISDLRDPYLSVRHSQVASPRDWFDFEVETSSSSSAVLPEVSAQSLTHRGQPLLPPPADIPEVPSPPRPLTPQHQQQFESALEDAVADHDWVEALQLTERWLDTLSLSSQQREPLQEYQQHLHSLLSTPADVGKPATFPDPPVVPPNSPVVSQPDASLSPSEAASPLESLPQPHLLAQAEPRPTPPAQDATWQNEQKESLSTLLPAPESLFQSQNQGSLNPKAEESGPPSLDVVADLDWGTYLAQLQEKVRQHWMVQRAAGSYLTVVQLRLDREGSLRELRLKTPSEDPLLDAAVLSAIQRSAPFAPLPEIYAGEELMLEIDVLSGSLEASPIQDPSAKL
ncbi:TonB C-terminal domain-containing protein [Synechococcus sp. Nb3U1]|uniref:TonB C-terminal domain-containing protein n=1 Tax=Synechococcus sp. Nb3U1 TaxID=1914529 RepID=UPI001F31A8E9|nr:TonB C-terminal domain-containing protein [Synechococcus sp. Nb3U1]MCF2970738.1 TonB C-terminal domain-containing protein [Synechococcus sp. Nb3U1]